jgi:hypothetical protein
MLESKRLAGGGGATELAGFGSCRGACRVGGRLTPAAVGELSFTRPTRHLDAWSIAVCSGNFRNL